MFLISLHEFRPIIVQIYLKQKVAEKLSHKFLLVQTKYHITVTGTYGSSQFIYVTY